jgi:hypothetical protein
MDPTWRNEMTKWEYEVFILRVDQKPNLKNILNDYGKNGWELVSSYLEQTSAGLCPVCYFKRPKA